MTPSSHKPCPPSPPATCAGGGGEHISTSLVALHKCLYGPVFERGGRGQAHLGRAADGWFGAQASTIAQKLYAAFNNLVDEHKAALIGFEFLLIGVYGGLLSRGKAGAAVRGCRSERRGEVNKCCGGDAAVLS